MKHLVLGLSACLTVALGGLATTAPPAIHAAGCTPTGFVRDGINLTAALINPVTPVTGVVDATGCNIGVYYDHGTGSVTHAEIKNANYYGVVVNGDVNKVAVDVTNSSIHDIGETPLNGDQHGVAIYYRDFGTGAASGTIAGDTITNYQKGGIVTNGTGTTADIRDNTVVGQGPVNYIAQNGIQVGYGASATVMRNTVSGNAYTGANFAASGGILVVGGPCNGGDYTTGTQIVGNTLTNNDIGIYLSNLDDTCAAPPVTATNIKAVNNTIANNNPATPPHMSSNISGNGSTGYQAGVSDVGTNDKIISNSISGSGYSSCAPDFCAAIDASAPYASHAKVHATK